MRRVIIESPFAGDVAVNMAYARRALLDSLSRGEAPLASHLLYTQVLDDLKPDDRQLGIDAGLAWLRLADASVVYTDFGISRGMQLGIDAARAAGIPVEFRKIGKFKVNLNYEFDGKQLRQTQSPGNVTLVVTLGEEHSVQFTTDAALDEALMSACMDAWDDIIAAAQDRSGAD